MPVYAMVLTAPPEAHRIPVGPKDKEVMHEGLRLRVGILRDPYGLRMFTYCYPWTMKLEEAHGRAWIYYQRQQERWL